MAAAGAGGPNDARRGHQSPRPKGRGNSSLNFLVEKPCTDASIRVSENAKNILCRNITIYGNCRAQHNGGCRCFPRNRVT
ncbi:hypothetical protein M8818_003326 [Zalaria obscura]|uniref:Uncharacterized protein n=1 Tax=Zalaria obscura TaxID=2024903 RepID=A0ACC3SEU1_9PEZI